MTKKLIQPISPYNYIYSSFFFTRCMKATNEGPVFDYAAVKRWSDRIPGGLANIDNLFIPINRDNEHWLFLQIHFPTRTISLCDSLGQNRDNLAYMRTAKQYLYVEHRRHNPGSTDQFHEWIQNWTALDLSHTSPRQQNGYDCGIFMLLLLALCAQGITLRKSSYTQDLVNGKSIRKRLVHVAWLDRLSPFTGTGNLCQWLQGQDSVSPTLP